MNLTNFIKNPERYIFYSQERGMYFLPMAGLGKQFEMTLSLDKYVGDKSERYGVLYLDEIKELRTGAFENMDVLAICDVGNQFEIRKVEI